MDTCISACKTIFILLIAFFSITACSSEKKYVAIDLMLKNYPAIQQYINQPAYRTEFHDTDILLQRRSLGKKYAYMYLLSSVRSPQVTDSLTLFEVDNQTNIQTVVFPRTPSPLTPLMELYYTAHTPKVYANTTAEMLNYLHTGYAQKTWVTLLDTGLCDKKWRKTLLSEKIYVIKSEKQQN